MHDIEPFYYWSHYYVSEEDENSPFYGRSYSEFEFQNQIYNYLIHPQWDEFGSPGLYCKVLFADYESGFAIIEFIGEWNDAVNNDIMFLKRDVADVFMQKGIHKFVLIVENVMNSFSDDDSYYEEWYEDISDQDGWLVFLQMRPHVLEDFRRIRLSYYAHFGEEFDKIPWRKLNPMKVLEAIELCISRYLKA